MGFVPAPDVPRLYFEYVTFFMDSIPVLISFGGLDLHGFIAEGPDWESRKFCHVSLQCEHQIAQETDARTGHGGRMCKAIHQSYACIASVTVRNRITVKRVRQERMRSAESFCLDSYHRRDETCCLGRIAPQRYSPGHHPFQPVNTALGGFLRSKRLFVFALCWHCWCCPSSL
jgi:hypothetical protein